MTLLECAAFWAGYSAQFKTRRTDSNRFPVFIGTTIGNFDKF